MNTRRKAAEILESSSRKRQRVTEPEPAPTPTPSKAKKATSKAAAPAIKKPAAAPAVPVPAVTGRVSTRRTPVSEVLPVVEPERPVAVVKRSRKPAAAATAVPISTVPVEEQIPEPPPSNEAVAEEQMEEDVATTPSQPAVPEQSAPAKTVQTFLPEEQIHVIPAGNSQKKLSVEAPVVVEENLQGFILAISLFLLRCFL